MAVLMPRSTRLQVTRFTLIISLFLLVVILLAGTTERNTFYDAHSFRPPPDSRQLLSLSDLLQDDPTANNTHQRSFRLPKEPIAIRECDAIPTWLLYDLAAAARFSPASDPTVHHFHAGRALTQDADTTFSVGTEFCSVIFAPQNPRTNLSEFQNLPIEGWGPDSIHAEVRSDDVRFIFVNHPAYWGVVSVAPPTNTLGQDTAVAVYTAPYILNHPGQYQITGEVEFQNYDWVMEDPIDVTTVHLPYNMTNNTLRTLSPAITITGLPVSRPTPRCHHGGHNDLRGRWYRASSFHPQTGNQTALNSHAALEFAASNTTVDQWGWTFAPDNCQLTLFSAQHHKQCLGNRTIQVLGDSNSRRLIKSIMGGGVAWCTGEDDKNNRYCECEDHFQTDFLDVNWNTINASKFGDVGDRDDPTVFGDNSKVYFDFVGGLLNAKLWNPWGFFYDGSNDPGAMEGAAGTGQSPSIMSQRLRRNGPIDVVHVSLIGWDMAAIRTPGEILKALPNFRERLYAAYPPGTRFIHRFANNMCCGNQNHRTRYSAPRFAMWNAMWRAFWTEDERSGLVRFDDPSVLQGRRDAETAFFCPTTHLRTSHVRLEQMMWMGAVCEIDGGQARMRSFE